MISQAGGHGLSRFSRMEVPYMPWFSDRAGPADLRSAANWVFRGTAEANVQVRGLKLAQSHENA